MKIRKRIKMERKKKEPKVKVVKTTSLTGAAKKLSYELEYKLGNTPQDSETKASFYSNVHNFSDMNSRILANLIHRIGSNNQSDWLQMGGDKDQVIQLAKEIMQKAAEKKRAETSRKRELQEAQSLSRYIATLLRYIDNVSEYLGRS